MQHWHIASCHHMMYQPVTTLMLMQIRVVLYFCNMSWIDVVARQAGLVMHMLADQQGFIQCTTFMQDEATKITLLAFVKLAMQICMRGLAPGHAYMQLQLGLIDLLP
jgi:hypothetical protein